MPISTLPEGHVWLEDAFERAWSEIEDAERFTANAVESCSSGDDDEGREAWRGYDESKERVEKLMRAALSSRALRAFIRDPQTGEAAELGERHLWDPADRTFRGLGLSNYPDKMITHGPYTGGRPVFVQKQELEAFILRHRPATNVFAQADLIAQTAWEAPAGTDAAGLADLPGGEWITLPRVLNFLAFGQVAPPDGDDPLVRLRRQQQAFRAMLERARSGKINMEGACSTGVVSPVPPSAFAHDLVPTEDLDGFCSAAPERMDAYDRWRNEKSDGLLWRHVTVSRASLESWLGEVSGAAAKKPSASTSASAVRLTLPMFNLHTALCEIYKDEHGGVATDGPAKRIAAVLAWRNTQKPPRKILPGCIARGMRRLDRNVFIDGKSVKLKGE